MNILFAGTSEFASIVLSHLDGVSLVLTKPDAPKGRGLELHPSPVKELASERGIEVLTPEKLTPNVISELAKRKIDAIVVVAYGLIFPSELLSLPKLGCFNIHSSLLPYHRGASPISYSILHNETIAGITIIRMDEGMDTGDIVRICPYSQARTRSLKDTHDDLAEMGAVAMKSFLVDLAKHQYYSAKPQKTYQATRCSKFGGKSVMLDFDDTALHIHNKIIALSTWSNFKFHLADLEFIVKKTRVFDLSTSKAGEIIELSKDRLLIGTSSGALQILELQQSGRKAMSWRDFFAGNSAKLPEVLLK